MPNDKQDDRLLGTCDCDENPHTEMLAVTCLNWKPLQSAPAPEPITPSLDRATGEVTYVRGGIHFDSREEAQGKQPLTPAERDWDVSDFAGEDLVQQPLPTSVQHIDADRTRGPSDWDRECQESRRLNR
jgi:hypothetical protein